MSRTLVTGATGFLGRVLVPRLVAAGHVVTAHGRQPQSPFDASIEYVHGDLASWRWDAVVHLAGPVTGGTEDWATGVEVVQTHQRLALQLRRLMSPTTRVVHASSMTVYGDPTTVPLTEEHPRTPRHLYGLAKAVSEEVWLSAPELDAWVLRLPGLFSEQRRAGALFHWSRAARRGEPIRVTTPSPTPWDILHVEDAAAAIASTLTARTRSGGAINISYGSPVELVAIARWFAHHGGHGSTVEFPPNVTHPVVQLDISRARALLGWDPPRLEDRLAQLHVAYREDAP